MKLVRVRERPDRAIMSVAFIFAIIPVIFLLTENAILFGRGNYSEANLSDDPEEYWQIICFYFSLVIGLICLSLFDFPLIKCIYKRVLRYKSENKMISYIGLYLVLPIIVVVFCIVLLFVFDVLNL